MTEASADDRFKRLLAQQLEMNPRTWAALAEHGVDEQSLVVVEFSFTAPGKRQATELVNELRRRTTFSAEVLREGAVLKRHWRVVGHTRPSTASVAMLDDWVTFMVTLGAKNGECRFDGWGVRVPDGKPRGGEAEGLEHSFGTGTNGHRRADG
jgi:hypothetical protein